MLCFPAALILLMEYTGRFTLFQGFFRMPLLAAGEVECFTPLQQNEHAIVCMKKNYGNTER